MSRGPNGLVTIRPATAIAFRKKCGLSQAGLAAKATVILRERTGDQMASISESLVALIETGRRQPSVRNAEALALAMDITVDALADIRSAEGEPVSA
ncbi:MAG TPA: helix-turn-helix transcriptional regulator [Nocardioides sp.]